MKKYIDREKTYHSRHAAKGERSFLWDDGKNLFCDGELAIG